jgi:hypothetical protein
MKAWLAQFRFPRGDLSGLGLKEKPQGETPLRLIVISGSDNLSHGDAAESGYYTFRRRAQYTFSGYSDRFHLYVPPFVRELDSRSLSFSD